MPRSLVSRRGRKPSIAIASSRTRELRKVLNGVVSQLAELEDRLDGLEKYYSRLVQDLGRSKPSATRSGGFRGRGPNVKEVALVILGKSKKPLPIQELAARVQRVKGQRTGSHFAQNLGAALARDRRFRRTE